MRGGGWEATLLVAVSCRTFLHPVSEIFWALPDARVPVSATESWFSVYNPCGFLWNWVTVRETHRCSLLS